MPDQVPLPFVVDTSHSPFARLRPVPVNAVRLTDTFWQPRRRVNRETTLVSQFERLRESGVLDNFRRAADLSIDFPFRGPVFMDSDLYKWLEAAASALSEGGEAAESLLIRIDEVTGLMENTQREDGYLNTCFARERAGERWSNLRDWHEMYCAGHLIQAAVAHFRATGSDRLLRLACRVADNLCDTFGPAQTGKTPGTDGHPEIELALVELFRATDDRRYLEQAAYFVDARGQVPSVCYDKSKPVETQKGSRYHQDHVPFRELDEVTGHAVRALYLAAGAADLFLETGEAALKDALDRQWENRATRRMYVSGGLGSRWEGESFGRDYELPSERAYTETCAAIAGVMWDHRMLLATGEARYADLLEWTLYNAVLPGLSLDGEQYFYQNPLSDDGTHRRRAWFGCACCPPNVARLLAQLPGYFWSVSGENGGGIWAHLYAEGESNLVFPGDANNTVRFATRTRYPWDGDIEITVAEVAQTTEWTLFLRIPAWCEEGAAAILVNGTPTAIVRDAGGYAVLRRVWKAGDTVRLSLPLPVRYLVAHPYISDTVGRVALARGPLLYCVEAVDNSGANDLRDLRLSDGAVFAPGRTPEGLPTEVVALRGTATVVPPEKTGWQSGDLYRSAATATQNKEKQEGTTELVAVPYYTWANRAPGQMEIWLRRQK